jgi:hypothetical protein
MVGRLLKGYPDRDTVSIIKIPCQGRDRGSNPRNGASLFYASETWKSERSYKPFSARLAFLRGFDSLRWYHAPIGKWYTTILVR